MIIIAKGKFEIAVSLQEGDMSPTNFVTWNNCVCTEKYSVHYLEVENLLVRILHCYEVDFGYVSFSITLFFTSYKLFY